MTTYDTLANDFLEKTAIQISLLKDGNKKPCEWDCGNSYRLTLKRAGKKSVSFDFFDSINNQKLSIVPSNYTILACVGAESFCPLTFEDFCMEYCYELDSIKDKKTFKAFRKITKKIQSFFSDEELEYLQQEIQ